MSTKREQLCGNCEWWRRLPIGGQAKPAGRCLRFPPVVVPPDNKSLHPTTLMEQWCGEWEARTWTA